MCKPREGSSCGTLAVLPAFAHNNIPLAANNGGRAMAFSQVS